ncbi:PREDICTED: 21 kDa protein [Prunus mume]|uniref:21 kDa protein n=1 Tax=Prunus mume TaxID=102107 RepID=A0ABM0P4T0_PRUMU|nr:PREDICTED: 21 kDa protein [Prunus mume]
MESSSSSTHFATCFLTALSISFCIISSTSAARDLAPKTNTEFIKTSCRATTYPKLCRTSLSSHASTIQTSPKLMAGAALNVTLSSAKSTSATMLKLSQSHGLKPKEVGAMRDCLEELSDSVDELQSSIAEMGNFKSYDFQLMISDVQTWVSAALTDENTCSEGFGGNGMNGNLKTAVRGRIVNIAQLTSNALALINRYASVHG